ncbi:probable RNA methyltransferase At5g51130 isoform X1 [Macadamia integrifolia]|uniref:probable RNA methyltransferase At5g51130 isoform X1 n=1 Tax=Macadamia integrifolia TaxID=60698 RepID=UPI001C4E6215|nr:probable RNA methyltransferase At5g51130 isoform X1 [Macadamia integrifolia]
MKAEEERNPGDMEAEEEEEVMEEDNNEKVNETQTKTKKRKRKAIAIFGNYRNYYGYRTRDLEEDPRLMLLKKEWFEGKDCLDIGCNQGLITISIAKKFFCQSICGIDIDSHLVESAYWNLRRIAKMDKVSCGSSKANRSKLSEVVNGLEHSITESLNVETVNLVRYLNPSQEPKLFDVVSFRKENFVSSWHNCSEAYDTILCLSVTKWVHLNWGDDGLITLFAKIWRLLRPGGILLLEAQNWKSYKSNYRVSEIATFNFHNILLPPSVFQDILLDKIGFRTVENITASLPGGTGGFNRPIFVFCK